MPRQAKHTAPVIQAEKPDVIPIVTKQEEQFIYLLAKIAADLVTNPTKSKSIHEQLQAKKTA